MKKMKKLFAVLVAFAMVMGMSMTSFAATTDPDGADNIVGTADDSGTIKVFGIEEKELTTVKAYPIAMAYYDDNGVFTGYTNPYELEDIENPSREELEKISVDGLDAIILEYDSATNCYFKDNQPVGMYLIKIPNTEASSYNVVVASIYYTNEDGTGNAIVNGSVTIGAVATEPAWAKKTVAVVLDKSVNDKEGITSDICETVDNNYKITLDPIPSYSGTNPVFNVTDVMSSGITYNNDLVVKIGETTLTKDTHYTATFDATTNTLFIDFVVNEEYKLNSFADQTVEITYTASLNDEAFLDDTDENTNTATLEYTVDSNVESDDNPTSEDTTYVYTFSITGLNKVDKDNNPLDGAKFTLYTSYDSETDECSNVYTNDLFDGVAVSEEGVLTIEGVAAGTYYLRETEAPDGYSLNTHVYTIVVSADVDAEEGTLISCSVKTDGADIVHIPNTPLSSLPSTGGIGTAVFTIGGCAIMIAAAYFFFVSRKKEA